MRSSERIELPGDADLILKRGTKERLKNEDEQNFIEDTRISFGMCISFEQYYTVVGIFTICFHVFYLPYYLTTSLTLPAQSRPCRSQASNVDGPIEPSCCVRRGESTDLMGSQSAVSGRFGARG